MSLLRTDFESEINPFAWRRKYFQTIELSRNWTGRPLREGAPHHWENAKGTRLVGAQDVSEGLKHDKEIWGEVVGLILVPFRV